MSITPGDVYIANVPYRDTPGGKARPILVISTVEFNTKESAVIAIPITSRTDRIDNYDVHITTKQSVQCGLIKESVARPNLMTALHSNRLGDKLGKAPRPLLTQVIEQVKNILGIDT